jgi:hypothetical protein
MDRDELQERIRARRLGADPYRRGFAPEGEGPAYARFEQEPGDATARRDAGGGPEETRRVDHLDEASEPPPLTREPDEEQARRGADRWQPDERRSDEAAAPPPPPAYAPPPYEGPGYQAEPHYEEAGPYADDYAAAPEGEDEYAYAYEEWDSGRSSGGGRSGAVAIIGFLALGVAALLGGAFLANLFSDGTATAPTPTPAPTIEPVETATAEPPPDETAAETAEATGSPAPGDGPVTFPDGVIFQVQACASTGDMTFDGCVPEATSVTGGTVYAWLGFGLPTAESEPANGSDTLVLILRTADGSVVAQTEEPIVISDRVSCATTCAGYIYQGYASLSPGEYELILERNGEFADRATFTVAS